MRRGGIDRPTRRRALGAALLLGSLVVAACGRGDVPLDERIDATVRHQALAARRSGRTQMWRILRDGEVTQAEYLDAYDAYGRCMAKDGIIIGPPVASPLDGTFVPYPESVRKVARVHDDPVFCQDFFLSNVEIAVHQRPKRMAEPMRRGLVSCLGKAGIGGLAAARDLRDFARVVGDERLVLMTHCINDVTTERYPDLKAIGFAPPDDL